MPPLAHEHFPNVNKKYIQWRGYEEIKLVVLHLHRRERCVVPFSSAPFSVAPLLDGWYSVKIFSIQLGERIFHFSWPNLISRRRRYCRPPRAFLTKQPPPSASRSLIPSVTLPDVSIYSSIHSRRFDSQTRAVRYIRAVRTDLPTLHGRTKASPCALC